MGKVIKWFKINVSSIIIALVAGLLILYHKEMITGLVDFLENHNGNLADSLIVRMPAVDANVKLIAAIFNIALVFMILVADYYIKTRLRNVVKKYSNENNGKAPNDLRRLFFLILIILALAEAVLSMNEYYDNEYFYDKLIILTPYVEKTEIDKFKSEWLLIENRNDFQQINASLDSLFVKNNLKIPVM